MFRHRDGTYLALELHLSTPLKAAGSAVCVTACHKLTVLLTTKLWVCSKSQSDVGWVTPALVCKEDIAQTNSLLCYGLRQTPEMEHNLPAPVPW